jgi:hypothetical protein
MTDLEKLVIDAATVVKQAATVALPANAEHERLVEEFVKQHEKPIVRKAVRQKRNAPLCRVCGGTEEPG